MMTHIDKAKALGILTGGLLLLSFISVLGRSDLPVGPSAIKLWFFIVAAASLIGGIGAAICTVIEACEDW